MKHCQNCGKELHGLYCSHCGQKAREDRITFRYIWMEIVHFVTHVDKGFLFTSWSMLVRPGVTAKNFIEGKRKPYQAPVSYFLIWTALFILLLYWTEKGLGQNAAINYKEYFGPGATTRFAISHLSIVLMIVIPFQAFYLWLLVTKKKYYYFETMIAIVYALGTVILLQFAFAVVAVLIHLVTGISVDLKFSDLQKVIYLSWFVADFIKLYPVKQKLVRAVVFVVLAFGTFTLWRLYGFPEIASWFV